MTKAETTERVGGYRVVRRIATGGTSDVLLAKAEGPHGFERTVVLKLLLSQFRNDEEFARMFAREASAYARLSHPSIVRLFDFFAQPTSATPGPTGGRDGQLVMVLEYVDGPPLTRLRSMLKAIGKELDDRAAIHIASRVFDALAAAHSATDDSGMMAPVIHRDVNPSNVLVPWDGHVKLADFGVAKVTGSNHQSVAGMIKGTYGYMAPEQVTGEPITPRADVYAGGIILWELLTRRRAFQRGALPEMEALRAMAEPRLLPLEAIRPDVDKSIRDAVKRALEPRAERRTITAEEMVAVLGSVVSSDEGRERLVTALSIVRNDTRAVAAPMTSEAPPPPPIQPFAGPETVQTSPMTMQAAVPPPPTVQGGMTAPPAAASSSSPRGMLPKAPPRPDPNALPRTTATYASKAPAPNEPPSKTPSQRSLPKATLLSNPLAPPQRPASHMALPAVSGPPPSSSQSAAHRLAAAIPDTKRYPKEGIGARAGPATVTTTTTVVAPSSEKLSMFDSLVEAPAPVVSEKAAVPPAPDSRSAPIGLAIDEVLRGVPSSMPPHVLKEASKVPVANITMPGGSIHETSTKTPAVAVAPTPMGQLPAAPNPLGASALFPPAKPEDFGSTVREMIEKSEAVTVAPPPSDPNQIDESIDQAIDASKRALREARLDASPNTPRMMPAAAVSALSGGGGGGFAPRRPMVESRTLAMESRPISSSDPTVSGANVSGLSGLQPSRPISSSDPTVSANVGSNARPPPAPMQQQTDTGAMPAYVPRPNHAPPAQPPPEQSVTTDPPLPPMRKAYGSLLTPLLQEPQQQQQLPGLATPPPPEAARPPSNPSASGITSTSSPQDFGALGGGSKKRSGLSVGVIVGVLVLVVGVGIAGTIGVVRYQKTGSRGGSVGSAPTPNLSVLGTAAPTPTEPSTVVTAPTPTPTASGEPTPAPTTSASAAATDAAAAVAVDPTPVGEGNGIVKTAGAAPGRRIFVDEKVLGQTPDSVTVPCGSHWVKLGSTGKPQQLDIPCGGEISVGDK